VLQTQTINVLGFQAKENRVRPLDKPLESEPARQAVSEKKTIKSNGSQPALAVPIRLRGEVIGILDVKVPEAHEWETDEVDIAEAVAERLSLALESALLLKATQRRAELERITADISGKIGATTQFESILRTAAEELSRALGGSEVLVQLREDALGTEQPFNPGTGRA
jgi:transcriptional regulator with GAF, ATPase, and Fis domain